MNTNLIGNREIFGIEYLALTVSPPPPYGHCRIWLEGMFLGDIKETNYLTSTCSSLEGLAKYKDRFVLAAQFVSLSDIELFNLFESGETTKDYGFLYIEGYDAFNSYAYYKQNHLYFLWQLAPELKGEKHYQHLPQDLCSAKILLSIYEGVVNEFKRSLSNLIG